MSDLSKKLRKKISQKSAKIGIIGMGYVGIPLSLEFANNGFNVLGFDKDKKRIHDINKAKQIMKHIQQKDMKKFVENLNKAFNQELEYLYKDFYE